MRIGYFGGSFDPVHWGHLRLVDDLTVHGSLDCVRLLPCGVPPHKESPSAGAEHRLAMLELAAALRPGLEIDARELDDDEPSYTVRTMEAVAAEEPGADIFFLIGRDSLKDLPKWYRIEQLAELVTFLVATRPGYDGEDQIRDLSAMVPELSWEEFPTRPCPISSSQVRRRLARGLRVDDLVPSSVARYIEKHGIYGAAESTYEGAGEEDVTSAS